MQGSKHEITKPLLPEIADYISRLTAAQRNSIFNELKDNPDCISDFLCRFGEYFLGRPAPKRIDSDFEARFIKAASLDYYANLPKDFQGCEIGFLCYISKGDNIKQLCTWQLEL
ncbi:MAG: hypothetical protein NC238_13970 [Dehalobacter sp.]|nr:hypothetical protein [Dehalobacter sp.]